MEKAKKILIFSTAYYPFVGGAEVAVKEITDRISGIQFDLITARMKPGLASKEKIGNVCVHRLGLGFKTIDKFCLAFFGSSKAAKLHKENKYDVVWSIMASQASIAAAKFKTKNPKVKLMLTMQEGDEEEHLKRYVFGIDSLYRLLIKPWHMLVFKKADFGTAISNYLIGRMRKNGMTVPIKLIPNGVDVERFAKQISKDKQMEIRKNFGLKESDIVLVTASRLVEKNGVRDVIKSLSDLSENIKFLILGDGELKRSLEIEVKKLKVKDRVIFGGYVLYDDIPKYLKSCDIFIRPSLSEGLGNSFIEAMACRIPVIATPVGGIVDFLKDEETGYFCEPNNSESIAETVKKVINDPNKNKVIENAYQIVAEKYDWDLIAGKMEEVFNNIYK